MDGEWVSPKDAAEHVGVSVDTVLAWCKVGKLHPARLGHKTLRISVNELEKLLEKSTK